MIQPDFNYACISWSPLVRQKMRNEILVTQNKYFRFCLNFNSRQHLGATEFKERNWLPREERVEQRVVTKSLSIGRGLHHSIKMNFLFSPEIRQTQGHIICGFGDTFEKK